MLRGSKLILEETNFHGSTPTVDRRLLFFFFYSMHIEHARAEVGRPAKYFPSPIK